MIEEITAHLVERITSVSALAGTTGTTIGGTEADPTMTTIPAPAAWVVFESAQDTSAGDGKTGSDSRYQKLRLSYRVVLMLQYGEGETDLKTELGLIEDVATAVRGSTPAEFGADPWMYSGCTLLSIQPARIAYALFFSTQAYYK